MFFRNLSLFRFPASGPLLNRLATLPESLAAHILRPCGALEMETRGFVSPYGRGESMLAVQQTPYSLLALGSDTKLLPTATLNQAIAERVEAIEKARGRPVGARERRKLKDDALTELLPRALTRPGRLAGYIDHARGWIVVDTGSRKAAEGFVSALRAAIGSLPAVGLEPEEPPRVLFTEWLIDGKAPHGFTLGDECVLQDPAGQGATLRARRQDLAADEIREHITSGKQVTALALTYNERIRFVLDEALTVRKFKLLDIATEQLDKGDRDSAKAELDARFALLAGEVTCLLDAIDGTFGVPRPQVL